MKISKLLKFLLGMSGFFQFHANGEDGGGPLDAHSAADAFAGFVGDVGEDDDRPDTQAGDSTEAAAERLLAAEAAAAEAPKDGEPVVGDKVTIEVDGKAVELTRAELAEHYKNGLRQADYTRKTMDVAEARKTADAETQKARQERHDLAQKLHTFSIQTQGSLQHIESQLTEELLNTDPVSYMHLERTLRKGQADLAQAQQNLQGLNQQHQAEQAEAQRNYLSTQQQELLAKLPDWKDPAKAKTEMDAVREYLTQQGFSKDDLNNVVDHRNVLAYRKAMLYDALLARASTATKKVAALPPKVERPGTASNTGKPDGRTEAMKRLDKTGSINDAASVFESFLN